MKKTRNFFPTLVQTVATLAGLLGLAYLVVIYIPASKVFFTDEATFGDALAAVFVFIPLSLVIGPICAILGIVDVIISAKQRNNEETKDIFSLIFLIVGIIIIVIPAGMIASMFIASAANNNSSSAIALFL